MREPEAEGGEFDDQEEVVGQAVTTYGVSAEVPDAIEETPIEDALAVRATK